jgi:hypothetical protein
MAVKFRPLLGAQGLWAGRVLYRAMFAVTRDLDFAGLTTHKGKWKMYSNRSSRVVHLRKTRLKTMNVTRMIYVQYKIERKCICRNSVNLVLKQSQKLKLNFRPKPFQNFVCKSQYYYVKTLTFLRFQITLRLHDIPRKEIVKRQIPLKKNFKQYIIYRIYFY